VGGALDIAPLAIDHQRLDPITVNIAHDLRATVAVHCHESGLVRIEADRFPAEFTGAGHGGSVWALGEVEAIARVRDEWWELATQFSGADVLPVAFSADGVRSVSGPTGG
jgi:hypothetical protein